MPESPSPDLVPGDREDLAERYGRTGQSVEIDSTDGDSRPGIIRTAYRPHPDADQFRVLVETDEGLVDIANERVKDI